MYQPYVYQDIHFQRYQQPFRVMLGNPYHQRYLCAESGRIYSHHGAHGSHSEFWILHLGNGVVELKTHHGKLIGIEGGGHVFESAYHHEYDTKFYMEWYGNSVAFRGINHNRYLEIEGGGNVRGHHCLQQNGEFTEFPC